MSLSSGPAPLPRCTNCGWALIAGAKSCPFCGTPTVRPKPTNPLRRVLCPHCGSEGLNQPGETACTTCGKDLTKPPTTADKVVGHGVRVARGFQISIYKVLFLLLVAGALFGVITGYRGYLRGITGDHMRNLVKKLQIYEGENGGFPGTLDEIGRSSAFVVEPREKMDGWERPIRYTVKDPFPKTQFESGLTLYQKCDVRSAGPNGKFDDDDDISWQGTATP